MKGSLHTDELMAEVVSAKNGLRTERRMSHVFVMDVPAYDRMLFVTDAGINIEPSLDEKADILRNAIDLARALGVEQPKVAILSAVETVNPDIRSTLDAAALCKMADRDQITGGILDGPLAFDNAISEYAARTKSIRSPVAGARTSCWFRHRGRQHAGEAAAIFRGCRQRRDRARGAGAGRLDQPRRQRPHAGRVGGRGQAAGAFPPRRPGPAVMTGGSRAILVLNAGSSSIKFCVFALEGGGLLRDLQGQISGPDDRCRISSPGVATHSSPERRFESGPMSMWRDWRCCSSACARARGTAARRIGHRVVHGGLEFMAPTQVDDAVLARLDRYVPLAPLHQPHNLAAIRAPARACAGSARGGLLRHGVSSHDSGGRAVFALPPRFAEAGVRRYGFHGLSYEYVASVLPRIDARAAGGSHDRVPPWQRFEHVRAAGGRSVATTMGFTAVEGLPMGTRCGSLDPGWSCSCWTR